MTDKTPMWDDEAPTPLTPLTKDEVHALREGDGLRVVTRKGIVTEGVLTGRQSVRNSGRTITLNERSFSIYDGHTFYAIPAENVVTYKDPAIELTDEAIRDLVSDENGEDPRPVVATIDDILRVTLGFDPARQMDGSNFGGKSTDSWRNEYLRMGALKKSLARLVDEGVLVKVTSGSSFNRVPEDRAFRFLTSKVGWVTKAAHDRGFRYVADQDSAQEIAELRKQAENIVLARHRAEVESELARLIDEPAF